MEMETACGGLANITEDIWFGESKAMLAIYLMMILSYCYTYFFIF
jgi:hypothetical protein